MSTLDILSDLLRAAKAAGADEADAIMSAGTATSVQVRLGKTEQLLRSESRDVGLRVFVGRSSANVSATALDPAGFADLAARAVAMARIVPEDPYGGLALDARAPDEVDLDLVDAEEPSADDLLDQALQAEAAALAVAGVTNSEGADASFARSELLLVTSAGFAGQVTRTSHSLSAVALAGEGTGMQRDYDYSSAVHRADLESAEVIGRSAGDRAIARLDPARPKTADMPVVYHPRVAGSLLGHLSSAINGNAITRGTSFLKEMLGKQVFAAGIHVHDDPRRLRGLRSRRFDAEGVPTRPWTLIEDGVLTTWLLDSRSARQLGLTSTGHAVRGIGGPPAPSATNLYLAAGSATPAELMADIKEGLFITELMGSSVNGITGDYSRGAAGFMIRDGVLAEPVAEITVAGRLQDMFRAMVPANDLRFKRGTDAPTVRIDGMTVAGA